MRTLLVALASAAVLLSGCGAEVSPPRDVGVSVDSPDLRRQKAATGIPDCPVTGAESASEGLPEIELSCLGGGRGVTLSRLRGPMVVTLWAQWCAPCREELPIFAAFARKYADEVGVLGIDWQDVKPGAALELAGQAKVGFPLLADPAGKIRARGLPTLMLLDADGNLAHQAAQEIPDLAALEALVAQHLGVRTR